MVTLLNSPGGAITALEKRARFDFVILHPGQDSIGGTSSSKPGENACGQKSVFDPELLQVALHPASLREWGINE